MTIDQAYIDTVRSKARCRQYVAATDEIPHLCDEIERLWKRERQLLEANNVEVEKRRSAELKYQRDRVHGG
jgi:hypothetical protein